MTANKDDPSTPPKPEEQKATPSFAETVFSRQETPAQPKPPVTAEPGQAWEGKSLGKYQVLSVLGQGGMGVVVKAHDPMIQRDVAIKVLAEHLSADETALGRFLAEARAAGKLNHPNVAAIYEVCQEGKTHYLVMEYLPGGSLNERLEKQGGCSVLEATQAMIDACKGISAAHAAGLIHRDIKPANFMRAADDSVKVTDFGLARPAVGATHRLTQPGLVVGTPYFMSPEQCEAKPLDARSDIYSLGATYYCLLTGRHPYQEADTAPQLMYFHCHARVPDPLNVKPDLPPACAQIVTRAMAKAPAARYQSVPELLADLQAVADGLAGPTPVTLPSQTGTRKAAATGVMPPTAAARPRRPGIPVAIGLALGALIATALFLWRPWEKSPEGPPSGEPIKVGVLHSLSGTMANSETAVVDATLFAIDEINQAGGLLGRPVKAVVVNGRSDWPTFAREAERLIAEEKVATVFGCWTSASRKTVMPIFEEHEHLLIYPLQYEGLETSPNIIYMGAAPNQQIIPAIEWAVKERKKKRFFLVGSDYVFPRAANEVISDRLKTLGAEVVGEEYLPFESEKVQTIVDAIARVKPDMILNTINGDANTAFFRALRAAGIKPRTTPTLSFSVGEQELRSLRLSDIEGDYAAWTYFQSIETPENEAFVRRFHDRYPQRRITDPMEAAYVGVTLWAQAVVDAESLDPKKIRRALLNQRLNAPDGPVRIDPDTQHCFKTPRIGQIQADGQFKIVWTAPEPVRPDPYPGPRKAAAWKAFLHDLYTDWGNRWAAPEGQPPKKPPPR